MSSLKKRGLLFFLIFITTMIQSYWSMFEFKDNISSSCLNECGFLEDIILKAFILSLLSSVFLLIVQKIKANQFLKLLIKSVIIIPVWFFMNFTIFNERESDWSTYSFEAELYYTFYLSKYAIIVMLLIPVSYTHLTLPTIYSV